MADAFYVCCKSKTIFTYTVIISVTLRSRKHCSSIQHHLPNNRLSLFKCSQLDQLMGTKYFSKSFQVSVGHSNVQMQFRSHLPCTSLNFLTTSTSRMFYCCAITSTQSVLFLCTLLLSNLHASSVSLAVRYISPVSGQMKYICIYAWLT